MDLSLSSRLVHADEFVSTHRAVAPALHVSTTFRYHNDPDLLDPENNVDPGAPSDSHVYSRESNPNSTRFEAVLSSLLGGQAITYTSGQAAFHALLVAIKPKRIAIGNGYFGCHDVVDLHRQLTGLEKLPLDCDESNLGEGDIIHVETPLNPTGEVTNIKFYADKARRCGAYLTVDATFAPPPLQNPFAHGADVVMHSGSKYIGGHSDILCGVLASKTNPNLIKKMFYQRTVLGSVMGNLESWLGLRSLRTLELRIIKQSETTTALVSWIHKQLGSMLTPIGSTITRVQHASIQAETSDNSGWLSEQMPLGYGPVFAIHMKNDSMARRFPSKLKLFKHATSLGGIESLIEWRAMTNHGEDTRLLRVSVGIEHIEDLKADFIQATEAISSEQRKLCGRGMQ